MAEVATMTNMSTLLGNETLSQFLNALLSQLDALGNEMHKVGDVSKGERLEHLVEIVDTMGDVITEMTPTLDNLSQVMEESRSKYMQLESTYSDLMKEQERLQRAGKHLKEKVNVQDAYLDEMREFDQQQEDDLKLARRLRDEMRDEVEKKEEVLKDAQDLLTERNLKFFKQYELLKADLQTHRRQASPLLAELNECNKFIVSRLNFFINSGTATPDDATDAEKLIKVIDLTSEQRALFDEVGELELQVRDAERALEFNQAQIKAKLERLDTLEKGGSSMNLDESEEYSLKREPGYYHLPLVQQSNPEDFFPTVPKVDTRSNCGQHLHRCPKVFDLRVTVEEDEEGEGKGERDDVVEEVILASEEKAAVEMEELNEAEEEEAEEEENAEADTHEVIVVQQDLIEGEEINIDADGAESINEIEKKEGEDKLNVAVSELKEVVDGEEEEEEDEDSEAEISKLEEEIMEVEVDEENFVDCESDTDEEKVKDVLSEEDTALENEQEEDVVDELILECSETKVQIMSEEHKTVENSTTKEDCNEHQELEEVGDVIKKEAKKEEESGDSKRNEEDNEDGKTKKQEIIAPEHCGFPLAEECGAEPYTKLNKSNCAESKADLSDTGCNGMGGHS